MTSSALTTMLFAVISTPVSFRVSPSRITPVAVATLEPREFSGNWNGWCWSIAFEIWLSDSARRSITAGGPIFPCGLSWPNAGKHARHITIATNFIGTPVPQRYYTQTSYRQWVILVVDAQARVGIGSRACIAFLRRLRLNEQPPYPFGAIRQPISTPTIVLE